MAANRESVVYDIHDFKVYSLLSDTGASPTYGPGVDVPGIASLSLSPNFLTAELKGDARIIAKKGRIDKFTGSVTYGKLSLDVLSIILGGNVTDSGTLNAEIAKYRFLGANSLPYWKGEFVINDVEAGLGNLGGKLFKCQITGGNLLDQSSDNFGQPTFDFEAIPLDSTDEMFDLSFNETLTPVSA